MKRAGLISINVVSIAIALVCVFAILLTGVSLVTGEQVEVGGIKFPDRVRIPESVLDIQLTNCFMEQDVLQNRPDCAENHLVSITGPVSVSYYKSASFQSAGFSNVRTMNPNDEIVAGSWVVTNEPGAEILIGSINNPGVEWRRNGSLDLLGESSLLPMNVIILGTILGVLLFSWQLRSLGINWIGDGIFQRKNARLIRNIGLIFLSIPVFSLLMSFWKLELYKSAVENFGLLSSKPIPLIALEEVNLLWIPLAAVVLLLSLLISFGSKLRDEHALTI